MNSIKIRCSKVDSSKRRIIIVLQLARFQYGLEKVQTTNKQILLIESMTADCLLGIGK